MTKTLLKAIVICAACGMLSASARAQSAPVKASDPSPVQNSSTKHLTATGRMNQPVVSTKRLIGAQVDNLSGNAVGQIQDVIVNPHWGRIDFALISLNAASANPNMPANTSGALVAVPWRLLRTTAAQYSAAQIQPVFTLTVGESKLNGAPRVTVSDLEQSECRQRVYAYYGVTPTAPVVVAPGADSDQNEIKGEGARALQGDNPESPTPPQTPPTSP